MSANKYNIIKAASWYTIGNIFIRGVSFFILPIFTRLMNTHEYGIYSVYTSYLSIFEVVILVGISATIIIAKYAEEVDYGTYLSSVITIPVILACFCLVAINVLLIRYENVLSMDRTLWNCLIFSATCGAINNTIGAKLVIEGQYRLYMGYSALYTIGNVGFSLVLCFTIYDSNNVHLARVFGSTTAALLCSVILLSLTKTWFLFEWHNIRQGLIWGVPLLFHTLATVVLTQSDRIVIRYMDSYSSTGIYTIASTVVIIPMVLQQSILQAWQPWFYDKLDKREYENIRWLNNRYIVGFAAIVALFMLVSPEVIRIFTEKSYWDSIYSLIPLAISVFGELLYGIATSVEYYYKRTVFIMTGTIITVIINIGLDIAFIYKFGFVGAAYATAISKIILFLMHYFFMKQVENNNVFSKITVAVSLVILSLIDVIAVTFADSYVVRYLIIAVILVVGGFYLYTYKDRLIKYIKR